MKNKNIKYENYKIKFKKSKGKCVKWYFMKIINIIGLVLLLKMNIYGQFSIDLYPPFDNNFQSQIHDDFDSLNRYMWYKERYGVHGNGREEEPEIYIERNVYTNNGNLVLRVMRSDTSCPRGTEHCLYKGMHHYTSGEILSNDTYIYGFFEICAKMPSGSGFWPAFWLWQQSPYTQTVNCWYNEIDVFEIYGYQPDIVESRAHCGFNCPSDISHSSEIGRHFCRYDTSYHKYGVLWLPEKIVWYIDSCPVRYMTNNINASDCIDIHNPMQIIINFALASKSQTNNQIGTTTIFPNYMYVDYFNYYKLICDTTSEVNEIADYNTFDYGLKKSIKLSNLSSLDTNQNIYLKAKDFIELSNGFEVPIGATLDLHITQCE